MSSSLESKKAMGDKAYVHEWIYNTSTAQEAQPELIVSEDADDCLAARLYASCVQVLRGICSQASDPGVPYSAIKPWILRNELGRLYLFGDSFRNGRLNRILEDANELSENIVEILAGIGILLVRNIAPRIDYNTSGSCDLRTLGLKELETLIEQYTSSISDGVASDGSDSEDVGDKDDDGSISEIVDPEEDLRSRVQMTLDLVPTLELTLEHVERRQRQPGLTTEPSYASNPANIYISLVRDKFPEANDRLVERLGEANWQRHLNIRKRMEQSAGLYRQDGSGEAGGTIAGSILQPPTLFHDSGIGTTLAAKSRYAQSEASHTSFISSPSDTERGVARVPPTPTEVGLGKPFRCYLCGQIQFRIKHRVDWKLHVFEDLLPYVCTFAGCSDELRQFPSRNAWAEHELQEHRSCMVWACPECPLECSSATAWSAHIREAHDRALAALQNSSAADAARRKRPQLIEEGRCCLCNDKLGTERDIKTHVGKHMEEIALVALPKEPEESSDVISNSDDEASRESRLAQGEQLSSNSKDECLVTGCKQRFSTESEKNRHALAHYQTHIFCDFCEVSRFIAQRSARGLDAFKQHLNLVHDAGARLSPDSHVTSDAKTSQFPANSKDVYRECPICESPFREAQSLHKHLKDCRQSYALRNPQALVSRWDDMLATERYRPSPVELQQMSRSLSLDVEFPDVRFNNTERFPGDRFDNTENNDRERGRCPNPGCGRVFKDLKAHMLTHQSERPEKCPIVTCEYHVKGFARKYDKIRHTLTHYKGSMVCHFCPGSGSAAEKSFSRADVFKRHLTSVHGVEQTRPNTRRKGPPASSKKESLGLFREGAGRCSTCSATFRDAQEFYEHLDDCVVRALEQGEHKETIKK